MRRSCSFAVRWVFPILGMAFLTSRAFAGPVEDFEAGRKAFRAGDIVTAMAPLRRASEAGHAAAQALYGQILDRSELDEEAVAWFRKSAEQNDPDGQFGLGSMLASGEGIKRDPMAARSWIEKSAAQGNGLAINFLAQSYINGQLGLTDADRSSPQALGVLKQAADLGFLPAFLQEVLRARSILQKVPGPRRRSEQLLTPGREMLGHTRRFPRIGLTADGKTATDG